MSPKPDSTPTDAAAPSPEEEARSFRAYWRTKMHRGQPLWDSNPIFETFLKNTQRYGIDLTPYAVPEHVLAFSCYMTPTPHIVLVTAGGLKIDEPLGARPNSATEEKLRRIYRAFRKTKNPYTGAEEIVPLPLPVDLTLPAEQLDGIPRSADHQYGGGYLNRDKDRR